jgi:hypothetical protein
MLTYFAILVVLQVIIKRISDAFQLTEQYACSIGRKWWQMKGDYTKDCLKTKAIKYGSLWSIIINNV